MYPDRIRNWRIGVNSGVVHCRATARAQIAYCARPPVSAPTTSSTAEITLNGATRRIAVTEAAWLLRV